VSGRDRQARRQHEGDVRPWEVPGNVRRDAGPHRGLLLAGLGVVALVCGFLSVLFAVPALVALPLGLAVRRMADHDLHEMRQGRMDPAGRRQTVLALLWGSVGALLSLLGWVPVAVHFLLLG
jgi:hypothetical protein